MTRGKTRHKRTEVLVAVAAGIAASVFISVPGSADDGLTPEIARDAFEEYCAACHGYDGIPNLPGAPNFSIGESLDKNDATLLKSIGEGKGDIMPPWEDTFSEAERAAILRYVRSMVGAAE